MEEDNDLVENCNANSETMDEDGAVENCSGEKDKLGSHTKIAENYLYPSKKRKKRKRNYGSNATFERGNNDGNKVFKGEVDQREISSNVNHDLNGCNEVKQSEKGSGNGWIAVPKKKHKKDHLAGPSFTCDLSKLFSNSGKRPQGSHLKICDIRNMYMLTVHGEKYPCFPSWCRLNAWQKIKKTIIIMVGCISQDDYNENKDCFPYLNSAFEIPIPLRHEGTDYSIKSPLEGLLRYRMTRKLQEHKQRQMMQDHSQAKEFYEYILTDDQCRLNEFYIWNSSAKEHGLITTRINDQRTFPNKNSKLLAIDCEMCYAHGNEQVLTRISIVDNNLATIYDELVKPDKAIADYMTQYSGITAEMLEDVKTRLSDVHNALLKIVTPDTILVGHSLDFDLRALQLHHDNVIDTSVLYVDQRGPRYKTSLKNLVKTYLRRDIQNSKDGHCSIEDAKACMELVLLKIKKGSSFGNADLEFESIFEALSREGKQGAMIDCANIVRQHCSGNVHSIPCSMDDEVVLNAKRYSKEVKLTFAHLRAYEKLLKESSNLQDITSQMKQSTFRMIDANISQILSDAHPETLVVLSLSSGYIPPSVITLCKDKEKRKSEEVKVAIRSAKHAVCFIKVT